MVSRLHAKTNQIGKILNNLEKYNHLMKDGEGMRSPTTPGGVSKSIFNKNSPISPRECPPTENTIARPTVDHQRSFDEQKTPNNDKFKQSRSSTEISTNGSTAEQIKKE